MWEKKHIYVSDLCPAEGRPEVKKKKQLDTFKHVNLIKKIRHILETHRGRRGGLTPRTLNQVCSQTVYLHFLRACLWLWHASVRVSSK